MSVVCHGFCRDKIVKIDSLDDGRLLPRRLGVRKQDCLDLEAARLGGGECASFFSLHRTIMLLIHQRIHS